MTNKTTDMKKYKSKWYEKNKSKYKKEYKEKMNIWFSKPENKQRVRDNSNKYYKENRQEILRKLRERRRLKKKQEMDRKLGNIITNAKKVTREIKD